MGEWITFAEGRYLAERALLLAVDERAVELEETVIEIAEGHGGRRRLSGRGRAPNALVVELLEEGYELDLLLDFTESSSSDCRRRRFRAARCLRPASNRLCSSCRDRHGSRSRKPTSIL